MTLCKVIRKGSYQGVPQWGIDTSSEFTPSRATAQKWADLENAKAVGRSRKSTFDLYWSPEGRKVATVEAVTERQAIRMVPQPYRKYLGEVYAVKVV